MLLEAGSSLGPFRIVALMGRGGMAAVYKAYEPELDRHVALKVLPAEFLHDKEFGKRFEREAKVIAKLEHPHIVPIHRFGIDDGTPWMSMRLLRSDTLADLLTRGLGGGRRMVTMLGQVADALDYAHRHGVVHRDVKPGNILFDGEDCAYVGDFGIARLAEASVVLTRTGTIAGTPQYMSPEQALGKQVDHRADLYALGVIAYEIVTGRLPFAADSVVALLMQHAQQPVPLPAPDEAPASVIQPIVRCLEKDPAARWPSARTFVDALADGLASSAEGETVLIAGSSGRGAPSPVGEPTAALRDGPETGAPPEPSGESASGAGPDIAFEAVARSTPAVSPAGFVRAGIGAVAVATAAFGFVFLSTRESTSPEPGRAAVTAEGQELPAPAPVATSESVGGAPRVDPPASSTTPEAVVAPAETPASFTSNVSVPRPRTRASSTPPAARGAEEAASTEVVRVASQARLSYEQGDFGSALDEIDGGLRSQGNDARLRQLLVEMEADLGRRATNALDATLGTVGTGGEQLFDDGYARYEDAQAFRRNERLLDAARAFLAAEELFAAAASAAPAAAGLAAGGSASGADAVGGSDVGSDDRQAVEDAVRRYAVAYERESTAALKAVFPSLTSAELDSIDRSFLDWESVSMDLSIDKITIDGPRAEVWMRQRQTIVPVEGGVRRMETGLVLLLAKDGRNEGVWNITAMRSTR